MCVLCIFSFIWTSSCIYRMLVVCQVYIRCVSFMICLYISLNVLEYIYIYTYVLLNHMYMFIKYCCLPSSYIEKHVHIHVYIYIYIIIYNINSLPLAGPYLTYDATEGNGRTGDACKNRTWKLQLYRNHLCQVLDKIHTAVSTTINH